MSRTETSTTQPPHSATKRIAKWIPIAAFAGTTVALALPLVLLGRQRKTTLRNALQDSSAHPPRRVGSTTVAHISRTLGAVSSESASIKAPSPEDSPRVGELVSVISKTDLSTALYAGKAFMIATGIVTVGALAISFGVKTVMGVKDTQDFAQRMRLAIWKHMPHLTARIRRPLETEDEGASFVGPSEVDPNWNWEDAEKRLEAAYEKGGFPEWIHLALKEMEAEIHVENAKRQRALDGRKDALS
ncbi:hypothetical protein L208DRAFT_1413819 [Tricholoma matsutake]|nr:hypothetical protein L208DRAFT_1413819 [Tricholoma matsutake 945]